MDMQKCCIKNVRVRINLCMVTMNLWESGNTVETIVSIQKKNLLGNFVATFSFSLSETGKGKGRLFFYRKQGAFYCMPDLLFTDSRFQPLSSRRKRNRTNRECKTGNGETEYYLCQELCYSH